MLPEGFERYREKPFVGDAGGLLGLIPVVNELPSV
jgi:hypothetical protein